MSTLSPFVRKRHRAGALSLSDLSNTLAPVRPALSFFARFAGRRILKAWRRSRGKFRRPMGGSVSLRAGAQRGVFRPHRSFNSVAGPGRPAVRALHRIPGFSGFPEINRVGLTLCASQAYILRPGESEVTNTTIDAGWRNWFYSVIDVSSIEPLADGDTDDFPPYPSGRNSQLARLLFADNTSRGYPCNQLLEYYQNFVVTDAKISVDVRAVMRTPGGAASTSGSWLQDGVIDVPVNLTIMRLTRDDMEYMINQLPTLLDNSAGNCTYGYAAMNRFNRVMREQFGAAPVTLIREHNTARLDTRYVAHVENGVSEDSVLEGIKDATTVSSSESGGGIVNPYLGRVEHEGQGSSGIGPGGRLDMWPKAKTYVVVFAWVNPSTLSEFGWPVDGGPNDRSIGIALDWRICQNVAFGDAVEKKSGISSGSNIVSRMEDPDARTTITPALRR